MLWPWRAFALHILLARALLAVERLLSQNPRIKDNLQIADKGACTNLSVIGRFNCIPTFNFLPSGDARFARRRVLRMRVYDFAKAAVTDVPVLDLRQRREILSLIYSQERLMPFSYLC